MMYGTSKLPCCIYKRALLQHTTEFLCPHIAVSADEKYMTCTRAFQASRHAWLAAIWLIAHHVCDL